MSTSDLSSRHAVLVSRRLPDPVSPRRLAVAPGTGRPQLLARIGATAAIAVAATLIGCATTPLPSGPRYQQPTSVTEAEYRPFLQPGANVLEGQAIRRTPDGRQVPVAGRSVTLDPATTTGTDWWRVAGRSFADRLSLPPSALFVRARRVTVTDREGKFSFRDLPAGAYYLRTDFGGTGPNTGGEAGGLLGQRVVVPVAGPILLDSLGD